MWTGRDLPWDVTMQPNGKRYLPAGGWTSSELARFSATRDVVWKSVCAKQVCTLAGFHSCVCMHGSLAGMPTKKAVSRCARNVQGHSTIASFSSCSAVDIHITLFFLLYVQHRRSCRCRSVDCTRPMSFSSGHTLRFMGPDNLQQCRCQMVPSFLRAWVERARAVMPGTVPQYDRDFRSLLDWAAGATRMEE